MISSRATICKLLWLQLPLRILIYVHHIRKVLTSLHLAYNRARARHIKELHSASRKESSVCSEIYEQEKLRLHAARLQKHRVKTELPGFRSLALFATTCKRAQATPRDGSNHTRGNTHRARLQRALEAGDVFVLYKRDLKRCRGTRPQLGEARVERAGASERFDNDKNREAP